MNRRLKPQNLSNATATTSSLETIIADSSNWSALFDFVLNLNKVNVIENLFITMLVSRFGVT